MKHLTLFLSLLLGMVTLAQTATIDPAIAISDSITVTDAYMRRLMIDNLHPGVVPKLTHAQLTSKLDSAAARQYARTKTLTYTMLLGYELPQPIPCSCVVDTWGPCIDGKQTATMRRTPDGCVGGPCVTETRPCSSGPVASSAIPASTVLVLWNTSVPSTEARAKAYATTYGIPTTAIVGVAMGTGDDIGGNDALIASTRATILNSGKQWAVLAWDAPSRAGSMSITAALTFGRQTAYNSLSGALPTSALYNYTGAAPKTDRGVVPCAMLHSGVDVARSSSAKAPKGTVYMLAANDQGGTPRGSARVAQFQALDLKAGYTYIDNRSGCAGECPGNMLTGKADVLGYFGSMYKATGMETNTVLPGAYTDRVTSTSGNLPSGLGQTPCTYELGFGFAGSGGTVVEPWQNASGGSPGWLVEQFVNAQLFSAAYFDQGLSLGQAVWSSVKCPGRYLFIGDPMCTPKGVPTEASAPPAGDPLTIGPGNVTSATFHVPITTSKTYTSIEFVNFKPSTLGWGTILGTGDNKPKLQMSPDGYLLWNGGRANSTLTSKMVAGGTYSFTVTLPSPTVFTCWWQDKPGSGGAQLCSYDLIRGR